MVINKRFLLGATCALLALSAVPAWAEGEENEDGLVSQINENEPAVLFKVHNIKPIKNNEGKVTDCEFSATFFNRSNNNIDNAMININWRDDAINNVIENEKQAALKKIQEEHYGEDTSMMPLPVSDTEKTTPVVLTASVRIPPLKPYRQVSLRSKISSDRCFLMMNDAGFKLVSCSAGSPDGAGVAVVAPGTTVCDNLFKFVSARDPEYYREFKKVAFNEEVKAKQSARKLEQQSLTELYDEAVTDLNKATDIIGQIR